MARWTQCVFWRRHLVVGAGVAWLIAGGLFGLPVIDKLSVGGFTDPRADSTKVDQTLRTTFGGDEQSLLVWFRDPTGRLATDPAYRQAVERTLDPLRRDQAVSAVVTPYDRPGLTNRHQALALVALEGGEDQRQQAASRLRQAVRSDQLTVKVGGVGVALAELDNVAKKDLERAELVAFPALLLLLLAFFRNVRVTLFPLLLVGGGSILGALLALQGIRQLTEVSVFSVNLILLLGLGLAVDYSLLIISRFREELDRNGQFVPRALIATMQTAGHTVLVSNLVVTASLLTLAVFPLGFMRSMAYGGAAASLIAGLLSLTVLPALLAIFGPKVRPWRQRRTTTSRVWERVGRAVCRYPKIVLLTTTLVLLAMAWPAQRADLTVAGSSSLPEGSPARVVAMAVHGHFPTVVTEPVRIELRAPAGPVSLVDLDKFVAMANQIPGLQVTEVKLADTAALLQGVYLGDPYGNGAEQALERIRTLTVPGLVVRVGGETAIQRDILEAIEEQIPLALGLLLAVVTLLQFGLLRSLVVPLQSILLSALSIGAAFGMVVLVFQDGHLADALGLTAAGSINAVQPVLIATVAGGLSVDYALFVVTRIKEIHQQTGQLDRAIVEGLRATGSIVSMAGLLLVLVIGSFALTGDLGITQQLGLGLALAIILDATLVRLLLMPALMAVLGRCNWWPSRS